MGMTANGRTDLNPFPGDFGKLCKQFECPGEAADVIIRLIRVPCLSRMLPDFVKIGLGR